MAQRQFRDTFIEVNRAQVTVDFASAAAGAVATSAAQTVTGAAVGDTVVVSSQTGIATGYFSGTVSAANSVVLFYTNNAAGVVDLASAVYNVVVLRPKF